MLKKPTPGIDRLIQNTTWQHIPCPICSEKKIPTHNPKNDQVLSKTGYPGVPCVNVICKNCGLIRINPRMPEEDYVTFYKDLFFEYLDPYNRPAYVEEIEKTTDDSFITPTKKHLIPYILPFVREGGKVFDIGAGFAQVLYILKKQKNIIPIGIEPDPASRKIAEEKMGIILQDGTVESFFEKNNEFYDFIVLNQVYEHLLNPLQTLKGLAQRLSPEGVIYIGVPNAHNPGMAYNLFFQLAHTFNYTPYSFYLLADLAGLKVISVRDPERHPLEVLLAHKESSYSEEKKETLLIGKNYRETVLRLRKKKYREGVRLFTKKILVTLFGNKFKERVRSLIDRS